MANTTLNANIMTITPNNSKKINDIDMSPKIIFAMNNMDDNIIFIKLIIHV